MRRLGCRIEEQVEEKISGTFEAHRTLGIRVFMSFVAVGGLALQVLTLQGSARVVSAVAAVVSVGSAVLCGRALYRAVMRYERATTGGGSQSHSVEGPMMRRIGLLAIAGAVCGPSLAAVVAPALFMPVMAFLMLVPIAYIDAGARDPLNPRVR